MALFAGGKLVGDDSAVLALRADLMYCSGGCGLDGGHVIYMFISKWGDRAGFVQETRETENMWLTAVHVTSDVTS